MRAKSNQNRASFTCVECLVLVVILGFLAALISAAAMSALSSHPDSTATIKFEVDSLSMALSHYKGEFGEYPPDFSDAKLVEAHILRRWPEIDPTELANMTNLFLSRDQALVFWLRGFSDSSTHPHTASGQREAYYDFDKTRLLDPATRSFPAKVKIVAVYVPANGGIASDGTLRPYIYFDARTYATATYVAPTGTKRPYRSDSPTEVYAAPDSFQLIHAGPDEDYGQVNASTNQARYPSGTNYAPGDFDNAVNFLKVGRTLDDAIPD
jgi:hypothetical protein